MHRLIATLAAAAFLGGCSSLAGAPQTRTMGINATPAVSDQRIDWVSTAAGYEPDPFRLHYGAGD